MTSHYKTVIITGHYETVILPVIKYPDTYIDLHEIFGLVWLESCLTWVLWDSESYLSLVWLGVIMTDHYKTVIMTVHYKTVIMTGHYKMVIMTGHYKTAIMTGYYKMVIMTGH